MPRSGEHHASHGEESRDDSGMTDLHFGNLFDQNETEAGDRINPVTGLPYDNSTEDPEAYGLTIYRTGGSETLEDSEASEEYDTKFVEDFNREFLKYYEAHGGKIPEDDLDTPYEEYEDDRW